MTIFSRPSCAPCLTLKKYLKVKGIDYVEKPAEGAEYQAYAEKYGFMIPLVVEGDKGFCGLNFSLLSELLSHTE